VFNAIFPHTEFKYWHFYRKQTVLSVKMNWIFTHNVHSFIFKGLMTVQKN